MAGILSGLAVAVVLIIVGASLAITWLFLTAVFLAAGIFCLMLAAILDS